MNNEVEYYQSKFSRAHLVLSVALFLYIILIALKDWNSSNIGVGIGISISLLIINNILNIVKSERHVKLWFILRGLEYIMISVGFLEADLSISTLILGLLLVVLILDFIMMTEVTDAFTRGFTIINVSVPVIIYLIVRLFVTPIEQTKFLELIAAYTVIILCVIFLSDLIAQVIIDADRKVFELRRLSENMNLTNEELRLQQEKVKRANEELGIQKIKLEIAYDKITNTNTETTIQNLIMKYISSSLEITTLLNLITESVLEAIGLDLCAIKISPGIAGNKESLYRIRTRFDAIAEKNINEELTKGCLEQYISTKGNYIDNRVGKEDYSFLLNGQVGSLLIIPLVKEQNVIGALICGKMKFDFFQDNVAFFEAVVNQLLVAIENASLYSKMEQMAMRDSLTGIFNRGQLNLRMEQYLKEATEKMISLSVALFDIDHFKKINDTYGHLFGDEVIKEIAKYAQEVANRHHGIAARYGGEEFVLVFQNKNIRECKEIVNELRQKIADMQIPYENDMVTVKVSVGIASYPETSQNIRELLSRADGAMYYSKENGRNQVTIDTYEVQEAIKKDKVL